MLRVRDLFDNKVLEVVSVQLVAFGPPLGQLQLLTFINPHVYLDTVVLIGTISLQFAGVNKLAFGAGLRRPVLCFSQHLVMVVICLSDIMRGPRAWRVLNGVIAVIMFTLAVTMLRAGGWY